MKKFLAVCAAAVVLLAVLTIASLAVPKTLPPKYRLKVQKGQGILHIAQTLRKDGAIFNAFTFAAAARLSGDQGTLKAGSYSFGGRASAWQILRHLQSGHPDTVSVRIPEGITFAQMRALINADPNLHHDSAQLSDAELLHSIDPQSPSGHPEGLFFPDTYEVAAQSSDLEVYRAAYALMKKRWNAAWEARSGNLPYQNPYELLIMASIIEKETAHADDRAKVAAVFTNRLRLNMPLQTDPSVIYGMGSAYRGKIHKADLQRDTAYNTYTRRGMPPTPIALPGKPALEAAANPAAVDYLYFVSRNDASGLSQFSTTLEEHNAAVNRYIRGNRQ